MRVELAQQLQAVAFVHPRRHLARVQAERNRAVDRKRLVLAVEVVRRGVRAFDGAVLHGVDDAERRHQFTRRVRGDRELAPGRGRHDPRERLRRAVQRVQRFREARREAPPHLRLSVHCRRRDRCDRGRTGSSPCQELPSLHNVSSSRPGLFVIQQDLRGQSGLASRGDCSDRTRAGKESPGGGCQAPPTVMPSISTEPAILLPRMTRSVPTAAMFRNMSRMLPAIVISSTG